LARNSAIWLGLMFRNCSHDSLRPILNWSKSPFSMKSLLRRSSDFFLNSRISSTILNYFLTTYSSLNISWPLPFRYSVHFCFMDCCILTLLIRVCILCKSEIWFWLRNLLNSGLVKILSQWTSMSYLLKISKSCFLVERSRHSDTLCVSS